MNKLKLLLSLILIMAMAFTSFTGCSIGKDASSDDVVSDDNSTSVGFNYSDSIDENGLWEDITALDYVELPEYTGISVPSDIHTITDEPIQKEIDAILSSYATQEQITDRAVKD